MKKEEEKQQEYNEILFWKVMHNKYIRNIIIRQIEELPVSYGERKKFKDINSLEWLIEKQEFSLLKCKLESNEFIEIDQDSLSNLFKNILIKKKNENDKDFYKYYNENYKIYENCQHYDYYRENGEYKKGDEFLDPDEQNGVDIYIQAFQLLSKYKFKELINNRLIDIFLEATFGDDFDIIDDLLFKEPYSNSIIIDETTIRKAIEYSSPSILEKIFKFLNNNNTKIECLLSENFKNNSIYFASHNYRYKDEMFEFILNFDQYLLYNNPISKLKSFQTNKRIKLSNNNNDQKQLLQQLQNNHNNNQEKLEEDKAIKKYLYYILLDQTSFNLFKDYDGDNEKFKNLLKLYSNERIELYSFYLSIYKNPIDGIHEDYLLEWSLFNKNLNCLNYLVNKYKDNQEQLRKFFESRKYIHMFTGIKYNEFNYVEKNLNQNNLEFIKFYTTYNHLFQTNYLFDIIKKQLLDLVFFIKSNEEYEILLKSIIITDENNKQFTDIIPKKWSYFPKELKNEFYNLVSPDKFIIQDTGTIDFIFKEFDYFNCFKNYLKIGHYNYSERFYFKFKNYQLLEYAQLKYGIDSIFFKFNYNETYFYTFLNAINNCDIKSIEKIDQLLSTFKDTPFQFCKFKEYTPSFGSNIKYSRFVRSKIYEANKYFHKNDIKFNFINETDNNNNNNNSSSSNSNIIQLLEYLNSSGYKLFSKELFKKFILDLSKFNSNTFNVSDININSHLFEKQSIKLLFESLSNISSNLLQIVLNNYNPFKSNELIPNIEKIFNTWKLLDFRDKSYYNYDGYCNNFDSYKPLCIYFFNVYACDVNGPYCCHSYESSNEIISMILIMLNHTPTTTTTKSTTKIINIIQEIINYLLKRLIKVYNVKIHQFKKIYQEIKSKWLSITNTEFIFEHSQFHVFFYLGIRSNEFIEYILNLETIKNTHNEKENYELDCEEDGILDPTLFTFDYIFNSPYNQLYESLKSNTYSLSYEGFEEKKKKMPKIQQNYNSRMPSKKRKSNKR